MMKFVGILTETEKKGLEDLFKHHPSFRVRQRAHSVLLSNRGFSIARIVEIYQIDRDTVSYWLDRWGENGLAGLSDKPRSGRPPKLSLEEEKVVRESLKEDPRSINKAADKLFQKTNKTVSKWTLRRIAQKAGLKWKRARRSHKSRRDEVLFRQAQAEIEGLKALEDGGEIDLVFFDEAGFSLIPLVPYAWQPVGETLEIPSAYSRRVNVLGFLSRKHQFHACTTEGSVDSDMVINCFDQFVETLSGQTVVIIDNAPTHTSRKFQAKLEEWAYKGLLVKFLPTYSSELNLIEILWRFIKYQWLPLSAYQSFKNLKTALQDVLNGIGSKYRIPFA